MRTTIDLPERDHTLFVSLARSQGTSLGKLLVELARRGLDASPAVREASSGYATDPTTGLGVFRSGRPVTIDDVRSFEE